MQPDSLKQKYHIFVHFGNSKIFHILEHLFLQEMLPIYETVIRPNNIEMNKSGSELCTTIPTYLKLLNHFKHWNEHKSLWEKLDKI